MINIIKKIASVIKVFTLKHKIISLIIILCLLGGGFWIYKSLTNNDGQTSYVLGAVAKGTIISSISGTGQVSAFDKIDVKPKVSGKIVYINIQKDNEIKAGTFLAQIDARDAQSAVQSAENDLDSARLSLTDINGEAKDALDAAYDKGLDALTTTYKDLASMKANLDSMFLESSYNGNDSDINYYLDFVRFYDEKTNDLSFWITDAKQKYSDMQKNMDTVEEIGWTISKNSQASQIENIVAETYNSVKIFLDLIRQTSNLTQRYQKISETKNLTTPIKTAATTTQITQLSAALEALIKDTATLLTAKSDITAKKVALSKANIDIKSQNLSMQKYENALLDAKENLAKYYIYSSIDGIISAVDSTIKTGDIISSGIVLGSIVTKQQVIEISLNEVDAVKVKTGQKVTIAFDALPDITATGSVVDVDIVGVVSQGVVSYGVKIALDIIDSQIKPGMSGSVNIITETKQNVLTVPNGAVKSKNEAYYVLVPGSPAPIQKTVEVGVADDTNTEIISGLAEGDQIVIRTISNSKSATPTIPSTTRQATQGLFGPGGR